MRKIFFCFFVVALCSSCNNELDVTAEWKEKMIVYGLLNRSDSVHYIKINKAFLGDGNALTMAQVTDSSTYGKELQVELEKWSNGSYAESYILSRDTALPKDPGTFAYPYQVIYRLDKKLDDKSEYHLQVLNTKSGYTASSKTLLVKDFSFRSPNSLASEVDFTITGYPYDVKWITAKYGRLHQLVIRFHYDEKNKISGVVTPKFTDWYLLTQKSMGTDGGEEMSYSFFGEKFYKFLNGKLEANPDVWRYPGKIEFMVSVAADELDVYMEVSKPSTGFVQEKGTYTNIENGLGIFSSRYTKSVSLNLNAKSLDELYAGNLTKHLGFCTFSGPYQCQ